MLDYVVNSTYNFLESKSKTERKKIGQFFTSKETAVFMTNLFSYVENKDVLNILDPGTGSGILITALIQNLQKLDYVKTINIDCYENNPDIIPLLKNNMDYIASKSKFTLNINIIEENYILSQKENFNKSKIDSRKYDYIISNPPYLKLKKEAPEALAMTKLCYGSPNIYFLFAGMSIFNLNESGEMVYIIPRSWTSGAYFKKFREYLLDNTKITNIHLFLSRDKVFDNEQVLQETIIIKLKKQSNLQEYIRISTSESNVDFENKTEFDVKYDNVVFGKENYIYLVTNRYEESVMNSIHKFTNTLEDLGLKMKTGLTVDFRNREFLKNTFDNNAAPLFYAQHISNGQVLFPIGKEYEYVSTEKKGLIQKNKNYLFIKRFTSKEEKRRLQCGIYLSKLHSNYSYISTHNKINFIDSIDDNELSEELVYGLYVIFNSTIYDTYYRILNGSTQVNSTEINNMLIPSKENIIELGKLLIEINEFTTKICDEILGRILK